MPRYKVCGSSPFNGHEPGSTFSDEIPADQEARAIARGSIEKVERKPDRKPESPFRVRGKDADK